MSNDRLKWCSVLAFSVLHPCALADATTTSAQARPQSWQDPVTLTTEIMPRAASSMLLAIAKTGDRIVVVGERGHVLLSTNNGHDWKQIAAVPTRTTLTAVTAVGENLWAVGHNGVIIHSPDGGENWQLQRSEAAAPIDSPAKTAMEPDRPLLDVLFLDANTGFAVGAYSLFLTTNDGGKTWSERAITISQPDAGEEKKDEADQQNWTFTKQDLKLSQESDPHLNGIAQTGDGSLFIAAERGSAFRSHDLGLTWQRLQLPYEGSMFGVIGFSGQRVLVFGLRGHVYESQDLGDHWQKIATDTEFSIMGGRKLGDGGAVLVGANGLVLVRQNGSATLHRYSNQPIGIIAAALPTGDGEWIVAGENGVSSFAAK